MIDEELIRIVFSENFGNPPESNRGAWKYVAMYYAIACGITWSIWTPLALGRNGLKIFDIDPPFPVLVAFGTLGPLIAAFLAHRFCEGNWRAVRLFPSRPAQWLWLALAPLLVVFGFFAVFPALISEGPPGAWRWHIGVLSGLLVPMFNYNLLGGPLFEEFGWRGFLQPRLQGIMPAWTAAIVVGILWATWHLPLFFVQGWTNVSPIVYFLIMIGVSLMMAYGFNASGKSVLAAILMHSAFNSSPRFIGPYLDGAATRSYPSGEWYFAAAFLLTGTALAIISRGRLNTPRRK